MNLKPLLKLFLALIHAGLIHQESTDQQIEALHSRIDLLKGLVGLLVDLSRDRFSGDDEELAKIAAIISTDDTSKTIKHVLAHGDFSRDQLAALISRVDEIIEGM